MSYNLPSIIKRALPAVVSITASKDIDTIQKKQPQLLFPVFERDRDKLNRTLKKITDARLAISGGSGFIVDSEGIVATNMHVITEGRLDYTIATDDCSTYPAILSASDIISDVVFLTIKPPKKKKFPTLPLGDSSKLELGEHVLAIGNALGMFQNTVSFGIVSGLSRTIEAKNELTKENLRGLIQTDAAINPGNSGGPLLNMRGQVVGINVASVFEAENIGFAIPINTIKRDLVSLKKFGYITRPFLGVRYLVVDEHLKNVFRLASAGGAWVTSPHPSQAAVIKGSPADKAGIKKMDIIIALDGKPLTPAFTLQDFLEEAKIGKAVTVRLLRNKKERIVRTTLEKRP